MKESGIKGNLLSSSITGAHQQGGVGGEIKMRLEDGHRVAGIEKEEVLGSLDNHETWVLFLKCVYRAKSGNLRIL